jgi:hypothetical protein
VEVKETMEAEKPTIALVLTQEETAALLAASSQYVMYAKRHPELQLAIPLLQDLQRKLVEQARAQGGNHTSQ